MRRSVASALSVPLILVMESGGASVLREDFEPGWDQHWMVQKLRGTTNAYLIEDEDGNSVLRIESTRTASALWHMLSLRPSRATLLSWRWKIARRLTPQTSERTRRGDDYAARILVLFDPGLFDSEVRAICYVWAAQQGVGSVYPNPYSKGIATVVLRTGDGEVGTWVRETRNIAEDFRKVFAAEPEMASGIALIVDTDDTKSEATAWFDDIEIHTLEEAAWFAPGEKIGATE